MTALCCGVDRDGRVWTATSLSESDLFAVAQLGDDTAGTPGKPAVSTTLTVTAASAVEAVAPGSRRVASKLPCVALPIALEAVTVMESDAWHDFESSEG